jgi:hypothetical protein
MLKTMLTMGALLCATLIGLPRAAYAVGGCSNAHLTGTYTVQLANTNALSVVNALNADPTAPAPPPPTGGFGSNPNSLGSSIPGLGRFYFNGSGQIVGQAASPGGFTSNVNVGTYNVNYDCTATITLTGSAAASSSTAAAAKPATFDAIVLDNGNRVMFLETDASGIGIVGTMERASSLCNARLGSPLSFGLNSTAVQKTSANPSGSVAGGGGDTTVVTRYALYSTLGAITLDPNGGFSLRGWVTSNGAVQSVTAAGTYTIGSDCSLQLSFASPVAAGVPSSLRGIIINDQAGVFTIQPDSATTLTGAFSAQ